MFSKKGNEKNCESSARIEQRFSENGAMQGGLQRGGVMYDIGGCHECPTENYVQNIGVFMCELQGVHV